ncbi:MAG: hypothetical protein ACLQAT_04635 [Candidatus Binataceae bacterium]
MKSTARVVEKAGAVLGSVRGRFADSSIYRMLLNRRYEPLVDMAAEIASILLEHDIDTVVCDANEGYNPSHDICGYLVQFAVRRASALRRTISWYEFSLIDNPSDLPADKRDQLIRLTLDKVAFKRKLEASRNYLELKDEYDSAVQRFGVESFAIECLQRASFRIPDRDAFLTAAPLYEEFGRCRVSANLYSNVIRYRDHVRPLQKMLYEMSEM